MPIRVLIVDDSALMRSAIAAILSTDPEIEVVGSARDGQAAIEHVMARRPDVITMDVRMPVLDGLQTTEHIMAYYPTPILVLTASLSRFDIDITFRMLALGALDVMEKPHATDHHALQQARGELIKRVKMLSRVRVVTHLRGRRRVGADERGAVPPRAQFPAARTAVARQTTPLAPRSTAPLTLPAAPGSSMGGAGRVIVIGASTGGPRVVQQILRDLPEQLSASVLVVQHIADGFTRGMVDWLAGSCRMPVHLAQSGDVALPGQVFVAPDNMHLLIDGDGVLSVSSHPALLQRPSVDVTMQRVADAYGARAIGVLLTGMGRDGAAGLAAIHREGGRTIAQNAESCVVYGMPRAAVEAGVVHEVLSPEAVPGRLQMLLRDGLVKERS